MRSIAFNPPGRARVPHPAVAALLFLLALPSACGESITELGRDGPIDLTLPWGVATPAQVGGDEDDLDEAVTKARIIERCLSLLVVRYGRLVVEEYFHGNHRDSLNDVRSVTKSVVSSLVGVALDHGFIGSLDETLGDHLGDDPWPLDSARAAITIQDLLTMTSGFAWDESDGAGSYLDWIVADDKVGYLLGLPLENEPGTTFTYNSAAVHLLGVVLEKAAALPLPSFAEEYFLGPAGIGEARWEPFSDGYHNGGAGLDLAPRDLARLGQLYLQEGVSGSARILPSGWTQEATEPHFSWTFAYGPLNLSSYGYLWWTEAGQEEPAYFAWGYGGQFVYVVPDLDIVVVTTTEWRGLGSEGGPNVLTTAILEVIVNEVVPAFR